MDRKIFCDALKNQKAIICANGNNEVWYITPVRDYFVCVEHSIFMSFDNTWLTLSNVVTEIEAYELTEIINFGWKVDD